MEANRKFGRGVALRLALGVSLLALAGCNASSRVSRPPAVALSEETPGRGVTEAPTQVCSDASSCRAALQGVRSATPASPCELRKGVDIARRGCDLGVAEGCTELGRMKLWGVETEGESDFSAARALFQQGCAQGDGEGCARQALSTLLGEGVVRDEATGMAQLQASCEKYPSVACGVAVLGLNEDAHRRGVEPEHEWMALFAQRGCDAADAHACQILGDAFREGRGVSKDRRKALALYQRACDAGNGTACANEAVISLQAGGAEEATHADDLFSRGCELGSSEACRNLVLMTLQQKGEVKDDAARQALFRQACDHGAAVGCLALYDVLKQRPRDPGEPLQLPGLLKRACRFGEAKACEFLDQVSSAAHQQCSGGVASSCGVLGVLLLSPPALAHEAVDGLELLRQACQGGDAKSCKLMRDVQPLANELTCRSN